MKIGKSNFFKIYLLPGITFQSIVLAGGYGTGQEIVQYFHVSGLANGLWGLLLVTGLWSFVCALCFVLARQYQCYDYKRFFKLLLGRGWFLFEIAYIYLVLIVLSVVTAAAANILNDLLGIPTTVALILPLVYTLWMVFKGSKLIEKMFTLWSFLLYGVFALFFFFCFKKIPPSLLTETFSMPEGFGWVKSSMAYAFYNLACVPAVLFSLKSIKTTKQAVIAGMISGPLATIPGMMLYIALLCEYPAILDVVVPSTAVLQKLDHPLLTMAFSIVLLGTLVETGVGLVHALSDRLGMGHTPRQGKPFSKKQILMIVGLLGMVFWISQMGLVNLITKGYGLLTWFMLAVFIVPLLTLGLFKLRTGFKVSEYECAR